MVFALGASFVVLLLTMMVVFSVRNALEQSLGIERSVQVLFAAESGLEAAFFHHNIRGQGTHFSDGTQSSQRIVHDSIDATVTWTLEGRTYNDAETSGFSLAGALAQGQSIQVPLQWDGSTNPSADPTTSITEIADTDNFGVYFFEDVDTGSEPEKTEFQTVYGDTYPAIPDGYDFGTATEEVLIDFSVSRNHNTDGFQTWIPRVADATQVCATAPNSIFICKNDFNTNDIARSGFVSSNSTANSGRIIPCEGSTAACSKSLNEFVNTERNDASDYSITFRPLLSFTSITDVKIPGIPYLVKIIPSGGNPPAIPRPDYTVTTSVSLTDYQQEIAVTLPERTAIGAFDYVILD